MTKKIYIKFIIETVVIVKKKLYVYELYYFIFIIMLFAYKSSIVL